MPPRLSPLPDDQWDERTREALSSLLPRRLRNERGAGPAMATLARHPQLAEIFLPFSTYVLFHSTLPPRLRELATLRVARRRDCAYEWTSHLVLARQAGLTEAEIEAAGRGKAADPLDSLVLAAVDELEDDSTVSDRTWDALGEHLDERQRMDLVFTVGTYALLAMAFNTFGVLPDQEEERS
ncbi:carboxymuconolactone decarboxylase family protein [Streptomyces fulvoviolaceus]|uniref:carboxymuconolactone decarboxylase family protein n=1 Tax=Streptomyces fulvoviolaceus TaxID=285535 RepID=UPI0021C018A4|nr:carboxymuconolactone decarboxylase family protein [Streptomyces fulvoviolaceus]MCT9079610.1 carboxymuconolactone decarboxylase family protein [Streptomyces fulvoviolaceus]